MPQMKPMSWLFLYLFFFSMIIIFNIFNFFIFINKPILKNNQKESKMKEHKSLNWKW